MHLAAHAPAHVGRDGLHFVQRATPLCDAQPGLLLDLAREPGEQGRVVGVDHPARRAPILEAAPADVADEEHTIRRLDQPSGNRPVVHRLSFAHRCAGTIRRYDPFVTLPAPDGSTARPTPPTIDHPNHPGRGLLVLAFVAILSPACSAARSAGASWTRVVPRQPTVAQQLIDTVPGTQVHTHSCDAALLGGALVGAAIAAVGAGIVAGLVLRGAVGVAGAPTRRTGGRSGAGSGQPIRIRRKPSAYVVPAALPAASADSRRNSRNHSPVSSSWLAWQNSASILRSSVAAMSIQTFGSNVPERYDRVRLVHVETFRPQFGEVVRVARGG